MFADCLHCLSSFESKAGQVWYDENTGEKVSDNFLVVCPYCGIGVEYTPEDSTTFEPIRKSKSYEHAVVL